ncbi:MAG: S8 family serine peptidase [Anaerolineae bacterium]
MPVRHVAKQLRRMARLILALALLLAAEGSPLRADSGIGRTPLCREDGVCLPLPRPASEMTAESRTEAAQAVAPASPCDAPLLVKREAHVAPEAFQRLLQRRGYAQIEGLLTPQWWRVCLPAAGVQSQGRTMASLEALPEVALVEPDGIVAAALAPNDPAYPAQWALPRIGAPAAWDTAVGSTDVMIAVIDSGIDYNHPDSPADLWLGWDYVQNDDDPYDDFGHGTHVIGIAAARTNNNEGVAGLCTACSVLAVKALDYIGLGYFSDVADAIVLAADATTVLHKRVIINLSLGGDPNEADSVAVTDAIAYAHAQGAFVVAAAGNLGPGGPTFPARLPGVLAVSATDIVDRPSSTPISVFATQYGDIAAPGSSIYSTVPLWKEYPPYDYMSGTSMATPLVAAAAGLAWSVHPEYSSFQVKLALLKNVDVPGGWDLLYGVGRLNVERAVTAPEIVLKHVYLPLAVR